MASGVSGLTCSVHGHGIAEATTDELRAEFKAVNAQERSTEATSIGSFRVKSGEPRIDVP